MISNGGTGPDELPKAHEHAARTEDIERFREGVLADRVVHDRHALAARDFLGACDEILARVDDRVRAAVRLARARPSSSDPTVPIIVTPSARAHWHAMRPTPPAAAWNRIVSPPFSGNVCRKRYWTVRPLSISVAAVTSSIRRGYRDELRQRASRVRSLYEPGAPPQ